MPVKQINAQVNTRNTEKRCEICLKLTVKTTERRD